MVFIILFLTVTDYLQALFQETCETQLVPVSVLQAGEFSLKYPVETFNTGIAQVKLKKKNNLGSYKPCKMSVK